MTKEIEPYQEKQPEVVQERPWVAPRVDIYESDSEVLLLADVPGVHKDQLKIRLEKDQLTIEGQVNEEAEGSPLGREFQALDYRRSFVVPTGIDAAKVRAELDNGVLRLHLPKTESLRPRQIEVKAG